jgi:Alkylmercury lyase
VDEGDLMVRNVTYRLFVDLERAPSSAEVAEAVGIDENGVRASWARLHDVHAIVLDPQTGGLRMASPFSAVPTSFRVRTGDQWWYANCAWDAFGICAALDVDGDIETVCADCGDPVTCAVRARRPDDDTLLFHCLVPAAGWWDDIGFT